MAQLTVQVPGNITLPMYWDLLNDRDKMSYLRMRQALSSSACKHRRHHSNEINQDIIATLHNFVMRGDGDDWRRALVCGICWIHGAIAINTRQLRLLLSKCKSSINTMFQNIGYTTAPATSDYGGAISAFFPQIKDNFSELRQWTMRFSKASGMAMRQPIEEVPKVADDKGILPLPSVDAAQADTENAENK